MTSVVNLFKSISWMSTIVVLILGLYCVAGGSEDNNDNNHHNYNHHSNNNNNNRCDWSKCLSSQLMDATKTKDRHNICRLLTPSLHCMQTKLPACRRIMGEDSPMYQVFVKELDNLNGQFADKCHSIYTTCREFTKCLRPEIQEASHQHDIKSLCQIAPPVISCFESAIQTCESQTGFKDVNFDLIESKLDTLRLQTSARCDCTSTLYGRTTFETLTVLLTVMASLVIGL